MRDDAAVFVFAATPSTNPAPCFLPGPALSTYLVFVETVGHVGVQDAPLAVPVQVVGYPVVVPPDPHPHHRPRDHLTHTEPGDRMQDMIGK